MMVISSAYVLIFMFGEFGKERSCVNRLNNIGERIEPCGTPFLGCFDLE